MADPTASDPTLAALIKLGVAAVTGLAVAIVALWRNTVSQTKTQLTAATMALETERAERLRERQESIARETQLRAEIQHWRTQAETEHAKYTNELQDRVEEQELFLRALQAKQRSVSSAPPPLPYPNPGTRKPTLPRRGG